MKFAIATSDRYLPVWEAFEEQGWQPVKLFTCPVDHRLHHNQATLERALARGLEAQISPMRDQDLAALAQLGCTTLIVASYSWRVPAWRSHLAHAVNFHPSALPVGRGAYPIVPAILEQHADWGVSCHQIEHRFDAGAILAQRRFALAEDECHESLDLKLQWHTRHLATTVAAEFDRLWSTATPQAEGDGHWRAHWTDADRVLDWQQSVSAVLRKVRAFGPIECVATVNGVTIYVRRATGWREPHDHTPGSVVQVSQRRLLVAVPDGFVGLLEWHLTPAGVPNSAGDR